MLLILYVVAQTKQQPSGVIFIREYCCQNATAAALGREAHHSHSCWYATLLFKFAGGDAAPPWPAVKLPHGVAACADGGQLPSLVASCCWPDVALPL